MFVSIDSTGRVIEYGYGKTADSIDAPAELTASNWREWVLVGGEWTVDLSVLIREKQAQIKGWVADQIAATHWRVERARERSSIGAEGETEHDVLTLREAIRKAGNRSEQEVAGLTSQLDIDLYEPVVLLNDYPVVSVMPVLDFMRLFTDDERAAVRVARTSGQSQDLLDFWELLQISGRVRLDNADVVAGVQLLEEAGLIATGRAVEILKGSS